MSQQSPNFLESLHLTTEEFDEIVRENPSMRGLVVGYVAEYKLRKTWFNDPRIVEPWKPDDHDRSEKRDLIFTYEGLEIGVEVKSLQSRTVTQLENSTYLAKFQCDASDRRTVTLPDGQQLQTTCLLVGQFDLLAVSLFQITGDWTFAFARNDHLPRSRFRKYTGYQREQLLATMMGVTWPVQDPFRTEPFGLLNEIVVQRRLSARRSPKRRRS